MDIRCHDLEDESAARDWDAFQARSVRGYYALLTPWLASFKPFHFRGKLLIARENGAVIGGQGILLFGWGPLKLACIPFGPILDFWDTRPGLRNCCRRQLRKPADLGPQHSRCSHRGR